MTFFDSRRLGRPWRFSVAVVLILGVGVGAGTSILGLVDLLLFRPPAGVAHPERVRRQVLHEHREPYGSFTSTSLAWVDYASLVRAGHSFAGVAAWITTRQSLGRGAEAHAVAVTSATPSFFTVLGVHPHLGRFFTDDEDVEGTAVAPCVAGYGFWRRELGGTGAALGRRLLVGSVTCTVVGVTPAGFTGVSPGTVDLWLPIHVGAGDFMGHDPTLWTTDGSHWIRIIARLKPAVTEAQAAGDATLAYRSFAPRHRDPDLVGRAAWEPVVGAAGTASTASVSVARAALAGALVLLLLIAANLANLFLVRELGRARETAVRLALGSALRHEVRERVVEVCVLALGAAVVGLLVATWLGPVVRGTLVRGVTLAAPAVDYRIALGAIALALVTGLPIALAAALRVRGVDPAVLLRSAGTSRSGTGRGAGRVRLGFVAVQATISAALLVGSLAFVRSFRRATAVDLGFEPRGVVVADLPLEDLGYSQQQRWTFYREAAERVRALPGVTSASLGYMTPWWNNRTETVSIPGRDSLPPTHGFTEPVFDAVTPDYLSTMRLQLRAGRWIEQTDRAGTPPVMVVNQEAARLYWPGETPLGRCMRIGDDRLAPCRTVVGVVADHRFTGSLDDPPIAAYFLPLAQSAMFDFTPRLFVRASGDEGALTATLRRVLQGSRAGLPAARVAPLASRFEPLVAPWRLGTYAFTAFGLVATIIAGLGLLSVLSYMVAERRRDFAIRMAIGATERQVALPVVRQGVMAALVGTAAGFVLALVVAGRVEPLLYHTRLAERGILAPVALFLVVVAAGATLAPARAAAAKDPLEVLKAE